MILATVYSRYILFKGMEIKLQTTFVVSKSKLHICSTRERARAVQGQSAVSFSKSIATCGNTPPSARKRPRFQPPPLIPRERKVVQKEAQPTREEGGEEPYEGGGPTPAHLKEA